MNLYRKMALAGAFAVSLLAATSCSKSDSKDPGQEPDNGNYTPATYPKGAVQGTAAQKTIGTAGGSLASTDGRISLTIPAGAVASNTNFSIQPVSNTAPLGAGTAYRLLPEGTTFSKPVTVTLKYDDGGFNGGNEDALDIVYQDATGTWKALNQTVLDKTNHTLSVQSSHFSDYTLTRYYVMEPTKTTIEVDDTTKIKVRRVTVPADNGTDPETPMGTIEEVSSSDVEAGEQSGGGEITITGPNIVYKAPKTISNELVEMVLKLKNAKSPRRMKGKPFKLNRKIRLSTKKDFFAGHFDGQPFDCIGVSVLSAGGVTTIQGTTAEGKSVLILINGGDVGNFPYGNPSTAGKCEIRTNLSDKVYETVYTECGPPSVTKYASGGLTLTGFVSGIGGNFTATLYDDSGCTIKTREINGSFNVRK